MISESQPPHDSRLLQAKEGIMYVLATPHSPRQRGQLGLDLEMDVGFSRGGGIIASEDAEALLNRAQAPTHLDRRFHECPDALKAFLM